MITLIFSGIFSLGHLNVGYRFQSFRLALTVSLGGKRRHTVTYRSLLYVPLHAFCVMSYTSCKPIAITMTVLSCGTDILIVGSLCFFLYRARTGFKRSDWLISCYSSPLSIFLADRTRWSINSLVYAAAANISLSFSDMFYTQILFVISTGAFVSLYLLRFWLILTSPPRLTTYVHCTNVNRSIQLLVQAFSPSYRSSSWVPWVPSPWQILCP